MPILVPPGQYSPKRLHHNGRLKLQQFGPIVRENLPGNTNLVYLFDPEDIEAMYAKEGRYPSRRSHLALQKYRLDRPHMFSTGGILPTNGKHWWELRRRAQKSMNKVSAVTSRLPQVDEASGAYTMAYVLYSLANNQDKQDLLALEARRLLVGSDGKVTTKVLSEARYLKAVMKETYRLHPISVGVGRVIQEDTVIRGFRIPKDTVVVTQNQVISRLPEHFHDPQRFLPERWLHKAPPAHPFVVVPFGHGPRSCIGRRMAEQNLQTIMLQVSLPLMNSDLLVSSCLQLISRYRVGWVGGELDCLSNLINEPDAPLDFTFTDRE
ncbi:Cytochrome P450 302a1, mitochondrial [Portunus trituberculatus]|uniref:Cytochrome P450 302a1, mitochondrial n=1 Tax=Portunus trituberculatus TaxID=210409 RepID=A0A5B7EEB5_PORTR|nr:Cytochrome P450 302a1, mitochondrial [Portunus trituberculatus]